MRISSEKRVIVLGLIAITLAIYAMASADRNVQYQTVLPEPSPLTDSLTAIYEQIVDAAAANDAAQLTDLLDRNTLQGPGLPATTRRNKTFDAYLLHRIRTWPRLDTTFLLEVREYSDRARLTMAGTSDNRVDRVCYIFLMFRTVSDRWRFSGLARLEVDGFDRYGHPIGYHETDLPPAMRFTRGF